MKKTLLVLFASTLMLIPAVQADSVQSVPFLGTMTPDQEVPAQTAMAGANALILVHAVRDDKGVITSGSVDFTIRYRLPGPTSITGLHIHTGAAGTNGAILIPTDISGANPVIVDQTGSGVIFKQVQFSSTGSVALSTINDLLANPQNFYVNIHTAEAPGGIMRSQLFRAQQKILMGLMSPDNEVPPTDVKASGVATVTLFRAFDSMGAFSSGWATYSLNYTGFPTDTSFTGFHIHDGGAGMNGPVTINSGIGGGANAVPSPTGSGSLLFDIPIARTDATFAAETATLNDLFDNPAAHYINLHTTINPGGAIRAQMRATDQMDFQVMMSPANQVPAVTGLAASALAKLSLYTVRSPDGTVLAGTTIFDVNFRGFPAATTFTGLHIHDGTAAVNGSVTINTGLGAGDASVVTPTGSGNLYKTVAVSTAAGIATLSAITLNPENAYVNLHTTVNPGGAVRNQLATAYATLPTVNAITSNPDTKTTTLAPAEILSIYGQNLAKYTSDLSGLGALTALPTSLNGVKVTIGGKAAPLYYVGGMQINAQVPVDVATGPQPAIVTSPNGVSAPFTVMVATAAPAIYFDPVSGTAAILKNSDYSLVTTDNPAMAGDVLLVYLTGLGQTTPPLQTGNLQPGGPLNMTGPVTATIGGQNALIVYSIASPGFAGLYQVALTVPTGVTGSVPLILKAGPAQANSVNVPLKGGLTYP